MSDIILKKIDAKYIYTHQICYRQGDASISSPIESGYARGVNMGIDMFTHDFNKSNFSRITQFTEGDRTKSWGIPEWLHAGADASTVFSGLRLAHEFGVKYLCPFAWGCGPPYDFRDAHATEGVRRYIEYLESLAGID